MHRNSTPTHTGSNPVRRTKCAFSLTGKSTPLIRDRQMGSSPSRRTSFMAKPAKPNDRQSYWRLYEEAILKHSAPEREPSHRTNFRDCPTKARRHTQDSASAHSVSWVCEYRMGCSARLTKLVLCDESGCLVLRFTAALIAARNT